MIKRKTATTKKLTKSEIAKAFKKLREIETTKLKISLLRDHLRSQTADLEDIIDSADESIEHFDTGIDSMERGLESLSKFL